MFRGLPGLAGLPLLPILKRPHSPDDNTSGKRGSCPPRECLPPQGGFGFSFDITTASTPEHDPRKRRVDAVPCYDSTEAPFSILARRLPHFRRA